jgi:hypothetical protein
LDFIGTFGTLLASRPLPGGLGAKTKKPYAHKEGPWRQFSGVKNFFFMIFRGSIKNTKIKKPLYL